MPDFGSMPKTAAVRDYIARLIHRAGSTPARLPNEMEIAGTCSVSRVTVRRAIAELEKSQYILRLPGRRGAFSNPEWSNSWPHCVGIVQGSGSDHQWGPLSVRILNAFLSEMEMTGCSIEFPDFIFPPDGAAVKRMIDYAYDGLLWLVPEPPWIPVIEELIREKFPVIVIPSLSQYDEPFPYANSICQDHRSLAEGCLKDFRAGGCLEILYLGQNHELYQLLRRMVAPCGIRMPQPEPLTLMEEIPEKLPELLKKHSGIDGILCDGGGPRYERCGEVLGSRAEWRTIRMFTDNDYAGVQFAGKHPGLNVEVRSGYLEKGAVVGRAAGEFMRRFWDGEISGFSNCKVSVPYRKGCK